MNLLDELREYELVRDKDAILRLKKGEDDKSLDKIFGLSVITLTPDKEQICNFASICYLFSLFNIEVSSFTAIPSGYVASFKRNGEFFGTFITEPLYISQVIIDLCTKLDGEFYSEVIRIMQDNNKSLIDRCLEISRLKKSEKVHTNIKSAIEKFNEVNFQNCADNDTILLNIVSSSKEVMSDLSEINRLMKEKASGISLYAAMVKVISRRKLSNEDEMKDYIGRIIRAKMAFDDIFDNFIIKSGYHVYKGKELPQDGKILNRKDRVSLLREKLQQANPDKNVNDINADIIDIINMCATDYSADIVYDVLNCIENREIEKINVVIPDNDGNKEEKEEFRRHMGSINGDIDRGGRNK